MTRIMLFRYGLAAYVTFFLTILYAVGFVTGLMVPKAIDSGDSGSVAVAVTVNVLLLSLFAIQHNMMTRKPVKQWLTRTIAPAAERSTAVLCASLSLMLLFWQWRPIPAVVWQIDDPQLAAAVTGIALCGWMLVFVSTFMINHCALFGLEQVTANLTGRTLPAPTFRTPVLYKAVRHPIYLGFLVAFWAAPTMTAGHLLFAAVASIFIFGGIALEERDLIAVFGHDYRRYRRRVAMLVPFWHRGLAALRWESRRASMPDTMA